MKNNILCIDIGKKINGLAYKKKNLIKHLKDFSSKSVVLESMHLIKNLIIYNLKILLIGILKNKSKENYINKKALLLKYILEKITKKLNFKIIIKTQEEEYSTIEAKKKYKKYKNINSKSAEIIIKNFEKQKND